MASSCAVSASRGVSARHGLQAGSDGVQSTECSHCLLSPCVTVHSHRFLGNGQAECEQNSSIRRARYYNYWKVLSNRSAWTDPRYLLRKQQQAGADGEWVVITHREVMPVCVLKQVRGLYPNPAGQPYMGHKWQ